MGYDSESGLICLYADGVFLTAHPQELVLAGSVANVPIISGKGHPQMASHFSAHTLGC